MAHGVDCARTWNEGSKGGGIPADVSSDGAGLGEVCLVVHHDVVCGERGRLDEICVTGERSAANAIYAGIH
jgi:hypothetical protein